MKDWTCARNVYSEDTVLITRKINNIKNDTNEILQFICWKLKWEKYNDKDILIFIKLTSYSILINFF